MPRFLDPKKSTQHRVAAIALYRALLSRCPSAPLPDEQRISLRNAVRQKFRKNRKLQSPYQLGLVFRAGYETLGHLDASGNGNIASAEILTSLVSSLPHGLIRPPPSRPLVQPIDPSQKLLACLPSEKAVLNARPYANVSGPRHVPILAAANGVPFLRIKKPQPPNLSRVLRQKLDRRMKRFHLNILLNNYWMPLATHEDDWDVMMDERLNSQADHVKWVDAIAEAHRLSVQAYEEDMANDRKIAKKMLSIVDKETKLALQEGRTIIRGRRHRPISIKRPK